MLDPLSSPEPKAADVEVNMLNPHEGDAIAAPSPQSIPAFDGMTPAPPAGDFHKSAMAAVPAPAPVPSPVQSPSPSYVPPAPQVAPTGGRQNMAAVIAVAVTALLLSGTYAAASKAGIVMRGEQGIQGLMGETGPAGEPGRNGVDGRDGVDGKDGVSNIPGPTGPAGKNGLNGRPGATGATGATGPQGPQGPAGVATCPNGVCLSLQSSSPGVVESGHVNVSGGIMAASFAGSGTGLTNVDAISLGGQAPSFYQNAANLTAGTLPDARLSGNVTVAGNVFNGISQLVQTDSLGYLPALNASLLSSLNASNIASGTVSDARLSTAVTLQGNAFNGASQLVKTDSLGYLPSINGSLVTNLTATNITSGTLPDGRLSANVTQAGNTFNGVSQLVQTDSLGYLPALNGSLVTSLTANNITSGTLPDGRLSTNVTQAGNTFNGTSQLVQTTTLGALPALSGANLTALTATNITSGTLPDGRLSANVTQAGNTFNGASQLVQTDGLGYLPVLNGSNLTNLAAGSVTSGTLPDGRLSANVTQAGNSFNGVNQLVRTDASGYLPVINGTNVTSLNATNVSSGTLADGRLSGNVALLNAAAVSFTGNVSVGGTLGVTGALTAATINGLTVTANADGFSLSGGTTSRSITISGGNLTVSGTSAINQNVTTSASPTFAGLFVNGGTTLSGATLTLSNNVRGISQAITSSASTHAVTFATAHPDANYAVLCSPSFDTKCFVTGKTATGFTLNFSPAAGLADTVDWFVVR